MTKHGDDYMRTLLIHGTKSRVTTAHQRSAASASGWCN
jgi:hypothetical protein